MQTEKQSLIETLMRRAVELAASTPGRVSPNPRTAALIFRGNEVIAEGRHEFYGGPHAEINAITNAGEDLRGASMVVTLEPCCHYGKTPPCTEAIIRAGISEVYIGMQDPNPLVSGKGIQMLEKAGVRVRYGILREACEDLNQPFIKMMTRAFPYIAVKAAVTLDGFMADGKGCSKWITSAESRQWVHRMRAQYDAVLIGMGTVLADDPELTVRDAEGENPLRIVYDPRAGLKAESRLVQTVSKAPLCVIAGSESDPQWRQKMEATGVRCIPVMQSGSHGLLDGLRKMGELGVQSVLVEGGAAIHNILAAADEIDRLDYFIAPKLLGQGLASVKVPPRPISQAKAFHAFEWRQSGPDMHFSGTLKHYTGR
jgi:diaminohydroxyphosphoribosylaminopyrimidine deaminase / 5-amino-6-(5-phosphoribosylamino)uracil reductase